MAAPPSQDLPAPALVRIMQGVPQGERLQRCALVCKAWAVAATETTTDVVFKPRYGTLRVGERLAALQAWLDKHSRQVVSLTAAGGERALRLTCGQLQQLQRLELHNVSLSLQPDSSSRDLSLAVLPALRSVTLQRCELTASTLELLHQASLTALELRTNMQQQQQQQQQLDAAPSVASEVEQSLLRQQRLGEATAALLAQQPQLVTLKLEQSLSVNGAALIYQAAVQLTTLTALNLDSWSADVVPALAPAALSSLRLLGKLRLVRFHLIRSGSISAQLQDEPDFYDFYDAAGTAELMSALLCLTRLQALQLWDVPLAAETDQQLAQFAALTASSQLSSLKLKTEGLLPLPRGALRHAFPPGRLLPQLADVSIYEWPEGMPEERDEDDAADMWCVDTADLAAMAAACSGGLRQLTFFNVLAAQPQQGAQRGTSTMHALLQLLQAQPQLTNLDVADLPGWLTDANLAVMAQQLAGLRELSISGASQLTDVGLDHVTQLKSLTKLHVYGLECAQLSKQLKFPCSLVGGETCGLQRCDSCGTGGDLDFTCKEVWRQLADRLSSSSPLVAQRRLERSRTVAELESQLAQQARRIAELEGQLARQAGRVAEMEQQLAQQAEELQQLRARGG